MHIGDEDEDWNLHMACATLINQMCQISGEDVYQQVLQYIGQNINSQDPQFRKASLVAFGSVLEFPQKQQMQEIIKNALPIMFKLLGDSNTKIRISSAWVIGRITELHTVVFCDPLLYNQLHNAIIMSTKDIPQVVGHLCWIICNLVEGFNQIHHSPMSKQATLELLELALNIGLRPDAVNQETNLQISAFTTISQILDKTNVPGIQQDIVAFIPKLIDIINQAPTLDAQNLILAALQSAVMRVPEHLMTEQINDNIIELMINICKQRQSISEEALYTCSGIALNVGQRFDKYMHELGPFVLWAMKQVDVNSVCKCGMTVCGDLARAIQRSMDKYASQFIPILVEALQSPTINRYTKLIVISTIGDISMAIKEGFVPYIGSVFGVLQSACQMALQDTEDGDLIEYLERLRECLVECYTGILSGLTDVGKQREILGNIPYIVDFLVNASSKQQNYNFLKIVTGLLGDIGCAYQQAAKQSLQINSVATILQKLKQSQNQESIDLALWAENVVTKL